MLTFEQDRVEIELFWVDFGVTLGRLWTSLGWLWTVLGLKASSCWLMLPCFIGLKRLWWINEDTNSLRMGGAGRHTNHQSSITAQQGLVQQCLDLIWAVLGWIWGWVANKSFSWEMGLIHWIWVGGFWQIGIRSLDPLFWHIALGLGKTAHIGINFIDSSFCYIWV